MRLVGAQLYRYSLPLIRPLDLRGHEVCGRSGVLVGLRSDDGTVGWGDVAPLPAYSTESIDRVERELEEATRMLSAIELRSDVDDGGVGFETDLDAYSPSVVFGLETALMGLGKATVGDPSTGPDLSGFSVPVPVNGLLAGEPDLVLREVATLVDEGYGTLKLKLGRQSLADDIEMTRAVRSLLGNRAMLRLDANRAWNLREAIRFGNTIGAEGIAYLEEPLSDPSDLPAFFKATGIPVALDESILELDLEDLAERDDVGAVILKPTLLGGVKRARQWAKKTIDSGMIPVVSSSFESGVGILGLARLASSLGCPDVAVGLDTYRWLERDLITPRVRFENGAVHPSPREGGPYRVNFAFLHEIRYA